MDDTIVKITSDLIKINSQNPPGYTNEIVDYIKELLDKHGIHYEIYEFEKNKQNLLAKIGNGSPTLILNGHMDVVPPGDESKWIYPPFSGKVVDDKIFGRGATDMKGGLATILLSTLELADLIEKAGGSLIFIASADEEVGGHAGMQGLVEHNLIKGDAALIAEPSGYNRISIGEKGLCQTKLVTKGIPSHGSLPILGENAILKMYNAIELARKSVEDLNLNIKIPYDIDLAIKETAKTYETIIKEKNLNLNIDDIEKQLKTISFNPGVIKGGNKINIVPDYCELELDMRVPPNCLCENVRNYMKEKLNGIAEIYEIDTSNANFTSLSEKIVSIALKAIEKNLNEKAKLHIESGATDGRYLRKIGIPTIIYGPGELFMAHAYNEFVKIYDLKMALKITENIIKDFFNIKTS